MTLADLVAPAPWPGAYNRLGGVPAPTTDSTLDAAGEYIAWVYRAHKDMTISHVGWRTGTVAGSPTADTRIETVTAATGVPSGTLWAANTNIVSGTLVSDTFTLHALTAAASILRGQDFAVKFLYNSGTSFIVQRLSNIITNEYGLPYKVTNTGGSAVKSGTTGMPLLAFGSSATDFYSLIGAAPIVAATNTAFNNTNGARRGARFKIPFAARLAGVKMVFDTSVGDFNIIVFDDAGTELSSSSTLVEGDIKNISASGLCILFFDNPVILSPDTWYRVAVEPASATNVNFYDLTCPSADYLKAMPGGANFNLTTYASSAWDDTLTTRSPMMELLFDQYDNGRSPRAQSLIGI